MKTIAKRIKDHYASEWKRFKKHPIIYTIISIVCILPSIYYLVALDRERVYRTRK